MDENKLSIDETIKMLTSEYETLEKQWDRIDAEGSQAPRQNQINKEMGVIQDKIEKLKIKRAAKAKSK